jgi:drug/metabolite transporter (DMT)-like permease
MAISSSTSVIGAGPHTAGGSPAAVSRRGFIGGVVLAMCGAALFSGKAIIIKLAYRYGVDPVTLITLRMLFAVPLFAAALAVASRGRPPLARADHLRLVAIGVVGYYGASYLDFLGLQHVSAGLERLVLYLTPTIVLLLSVLVLRQPVTRRDAGALLLSYGGIALVVRHDVSFATGRVALGVVLVFASAVCYALYLVGAGTMVRRIGAIRLTAYAMCVSTLACVVQFVALRPLAALQLPAAVYGLSLFNGVLCTVVPVFATMLAVERIGAGSAALAGNVGPVATIVFGYLLLGEPLGAWQLAGTALVLLGVFVLAGKPLPRRPEHSAPAAVATDTVQPRFRSRQ